jgi:hypothetical protein
MLVQFKLIAEFNKNLIKANRCQTLTRALNNVNTKPRKVTLINVFLDLVYSVKSVLINFK